MAGGGDDHPPLFHVKQVSTYPPSPGARQPHGRRERRRLGERSETALARVDFSLSVAGDCPHVFHVKLVSTYPRERESDTRLAASRA